MKSLYYMERMTYPQIERLAARTDLALLPVGPPEAHGPHLPIGTDHTAARELCDRAARELEAEGTECLIAPLLPYCLAEVARPFPGTISVRAEIVAALLADICCGLAASGFRSILIVSGHAEEENLAALRTGAAQADKAGALVEVSKWYGDALPGLLHLLAEDHPEYDIHAGEWETALMLLRVPELVDQTALEALPPNWGTRNLSERRPPGLGPSLSWERRKPTAEILAGQPRELLSASTRPSVSSLQEREHRYFGPEISSQHRQNSAAILIEYPLAALFPLGLNTLSGWWTKS